MDSDRHDKIIHNSVFYVSSVNVTLIYFLEKVIIQIQKYRICNLKKIRKSHFINCTSELGSEQPNLIY